MPVFHFYTPWKRQKTSGFLTFSGGIEMEHWRQNGLIQNYGAASTRPSILVSQKKKKEEEIYHR